MRSVLTASLLLCLLSVPALAATRTAVANNDWTLAATWGGGAPAAGDVLIIPADREVRITNNLSYSGAPMRVRVFGTLRFVGGGAKIALPCGSIIELMTNTSRILGNTSGNSQTIKICNTTYWSASDGPQSGYLAWPINATLPVELIHLDATNEGNNVAISWATATEHRSAGFTVQRSDGDSWSTLDEVPAAGTSLARVDYRYIDVPPNAGTWYYRLFQDDLDGTRHALGLVAVVTGTALEFHCWPVPADRYLHVRCDDAPITLTLRDAAGRSLLHRTLDEPDALMDVGALPSGT